jgi:hypothetical protein
VIQGASHIMKSKLRIDPNLPCQCNPRLCKKPVKVVVDNNLESNKGVNNLKSNQDAKVDYDKKHCYYDLCNEG